MLTPSLKVKVPIQVTDKKEQGSFFYLSTIMTLTILILLNQYFDGK